MYSARNNRPCGALHRLDLQVRRRHRLHRRRRLGLGRRGAELDTRPGALDGDYVGVSASATVGVGLGANALIGGLDKSVALQPLSVSGEKGLNVAAGVGAISLTSYALANKIPAGGSPPAQTLFAGGYSA